MDDGEHVENSRNALNEDTGYFSGKVLDDNQYTVRQFGDVNIQMHNDVEQLF